MIHISKEDLVNQAVKHFANGNPSEAVKILEQVISNYPDFLEAWINLGTYYCESNQAEQAVTYFQKALELDSLNGTLWFYLSISYSDLQQFNKAHDASITALALEPFNQKIWLNHGYILEKAGLPKDSIMFDKLKQAINQKRKELNLPVVTIK
ncbi:MAG: tetratricopeptide repeat protein [Candidatus Heimdallarchaeota archaeon]|nr:tetratricopeptide repeat protein [Candidatus Heimdallarchaeota archaeon]